jgi:hypothetical protein
VDTSRLPPGSRAALTAATRAAIAALGSPASTGPAAAAEMLNASAGLISKWGSETYAESPSIEVAALIELTSGAPIYAAVFAALTGHRLVAIAADETRIDLIGGLHGLGAAVHRLLAEWHAAADDGRVVPREARELLAAVTDLQTLLADLARELARVAAAEKETGR